MSVASGSTGSISRGPDEEVERLVRELIAEATAALRLQPPNFPHARVILAEAYSVAPQMVGDDFARLLIQAGRSMEGAGDLRGALKEYREAQAVAQSADLKSQIADRVDILERETQRRPAATWSLDAVKQRRLVTALLIVVFLGLVFFIGQRVSRSQEASSMAATATAQGRIVSTAQAVSAATAMAGPTATAQAVATATAVAGATATTMAATAVSAQATASIRAEAVSLLGSAVYQRDRGELGLALLQARQALSKWPDYPEALGFVATVAPQATATAATAIAQATSAAATEIARPPVSLATGTNITPPRTPTGPGRLTIINGTSLDAVAKLVDTTVQQDGTRRYVYIKAMSETTMVGIRPGSYVLRFQLGMDWEMGTRQFRRNPDFFVFVEPFDFQYKDYTVTLHFVINPIGRAEAKEITPAEFGYD